MIQSRQNNLVKRLRSLFDKKGRSLYGSFLVEGEKSVAEAVRLGADVRCVLGEERLLERYDRSPFRVESADRNIVEYCSDSVTPQGIVAEVGIPSERDHTGSKVVLLDGVSDPGNVGTIIRTCAAVGVDDLILLGSVDAYSPKCVRSSMSGVFSVNIHQTANCDKALELVKGKRLLVADMSGENLFDLEPMDEFCLVIGNEAHGVSAKLKSIADKTISIPMKSAMESLNAGVSCSIVLYQLLKNNI